MELDVSELLRKTKVIALVGASAKRLKDSNLSLRYLVEQGFTVIPINPALEEIEGLKTYPSVRDIPADVKVDIVNIYRRPEFVEEIVKDTINRSLDLGHQRPVIWTQFGVSSEEGLSLATEFTMPYIKNQCILVAHSRLKAE